MTTNAWQLVGGHPALDFLDTIHDWTADEPRDYLTDFAEVLRFAESAGLVTRPEARRIAPDGSEGETRRLRDLRTRLERIFRSVVSGEPVAPHDLVRLARDAALAADVATLEWAAGSITRQITTDAAGAAVIRWRLVDASVGLLTSPRIDRVKACPSCGWFFLDTSKNGSRRWCSMTTCGSNEKSKRYYWRNRG